MASVATALARYDLPVPGGYNMELNEKKIATSARLPTHPKQQDALPCDTFAREQMRKLDRENDSFLQRFFGAFKTRHIGPFDVRLLEDNCAFELSLQFLLLGIFSVRVAVAILFLAASANS